MDNKELISSVKSVLARLQSFGVSREDLRNLLVLLFLLRWLRDEMSSYVDYNGEVDSLRLADRLNTLFSSNISFHEIDQHVYESLNLLRYSVKVEGLSELDFSSKNHLFKDKRVVMEALHWFNQWGGLRLDHRKDTSQLFEVILQETRTPQTTQFSSSKLLSQLIVAIAAPKSGETILDPCAGEGNFLIAAHNAIEAADTDFLSQTSFTGYDLSEDAILIAIVRFFLSGAFNFHLSRRSGLYDSYGRDQHPKYDVVLAQPPVGIKREDYRHLSYENQFPVITNDIVAMFIQQAVFSLKPGGRAVIAIPEGLLFGKNRSQIELRRFLVEHGYIEAVVRIPPKTLIEDSGIRGALLLLSNSKKRNRRVRFADLATYFHRNINKSSQVLPKVLVEQIIERLFCEELPEAIPLPLGMKEGTVGTGVSTRAFWDASIEDIESNSWDLNPVRNEDDALTLLLTDFRKLMGDEVRVENLSKVAQINTGKSVRSTEQTEIKNPYGYIRIRDVEHFRIQKITTWLQRDLARAYSRNQLYKGNILISKTGTIGKLALVDDKSEGSFAGNNFYVLRINSAKVSSEYLLYYLSTSFCQDWLDSRKRGAVQQHINTDVIKTLPILLPSKEMQKRAVAQYEQHGTDVITFLKENSKQADEKAIERLVDVMEVEVAKLVGNDMSIEKSAYLLSEISLKALGIEGVIDELSSQKKDWYPSVLNMLRVLKDINKIPPGPVLLNIFQSIGEQIIQLLETTAGNYNQEERLLRVFGSIGGRVHRCIDKILANISIVVSSSVSELEKNSNVEFSILLDNQGFLPLKNVVVETSPNFGSGDTYYLADHTSMEVSLSCKTTDVDRVSFTVMWRAETLAGKQVSRNSELAIKLTQLNEEFKSFDTASNPYVTGSPLEPENGALVFYGRETFIQQVVRQIEGNGNVILLEGNRRSGKTSILKHLEGSKTIPNWLVVYSSLQGAEGASDKVGVPTVEVFREMARSIAFAITKTGVDVPLPDGKIILAGKPALGIARSCKAGIGEDSPFIDFRDYLEVLLSVLEEKQLGIVLMLDEFDKLQEGIDNGVTSPQLPENIRYLIQNYSRFSAILTGSRRLKRLREEYWSALYGLGTNLTVSALDKSSAEKVVVEPVKEYIAYSGEAVELILGLTGRQPYLIQKICNRIFDYAVRNAAHSIKTYDVNLITDELIVADEHFASLWDYARLGPANGGYRRQALLCVLSSNFDNKPLCTFGMLQEYLVQSGVDVKDEDLEADIAYLRELELVYFFGEDGTGGYYAIEVPLMAKWITYHQDSEVVLKNTLNEEGANNDK
ncbi:N-6 DNA methylase [Aliivibrio fischeri]|uniref:N-6 DNA methylase n=1 Tax=Aliivibrio fischeri TaxID=668 RepID=UPI0012DAC873|nr:N-6 DNA methylase [Aliivibrio fischeri]MUJ23122.1 N-6 DNA methylase [Aliivibrio fischeri]